MRLSFGQEMRMVQKQILAPRMIQSMEILQLPIMALQERIEQEMQENEALELQELDPDLPEEEDEARQPRRAHRRRARAGRRRKERTTKTISNACCSSTKNGPTISKSAAVPRPPAWKKKGNASTMRWPTPWIAPNRSTIICTIS